MHRVGSVAGKVPAPSVLLLIFPQAAPCSFLPAGCRAGRLRLMAADFICCSGQGHSAISSTCLHMHACCSGSVRPHTLSGICAPFNYSSSHRHHTQCRVPLPSITIGTFNGDPGPAGGLRMHPSALRLRRLAPLACMHVHMHIFGMYGRPHIYQSSSFAYARMCAESFTPPAPSHPHPLPPCPPSPSAKS